MVSKGKKNVKETKTAPVHGSRCFTPHGVELYPSMAVYCMTYFKKNGPTAESTADMFVRKTISKITLVGGHEDKSKVFFTDGTYRHLNTYGRTWFKM